MSNLPALKIIVHREKLCDRTLFGNPMTLLCLVLDILSAIIIGTGQSGPVFGLLLVVMSLPLLFFPPSLIPLIFVSSWSISFGVYSLAGFFYYYTLFLLSILLNKSNVRFVRGISSPEWFLIAFCFWTLIVGVRSVSGDLFISLKAALYMVPALSMFHIKLKGANYIDDVIFIIAAVFSIIFFYHALVSPYYIEVEGVYTIKSSMTVIEGVNTNTASQIVAINFLLIFVHSMRKFSLLGLAVACLNCYSIFAMGSRTSFFTLLFLSALYLLLYQRKHKTVLILVLLLALFSYIAVKLSSGLEGLERMNIVSIFEDQGSGRFLNWAIYFSEVLPGYWFSGIGITKYNYECLGYLFDADNLYVDLLCETGVIGFLLFICFFITLSYRLSKCRKKCRRLDASWLALLSFFMLGMGETIFDAPLFWFVAMYGVIGITHSTTAHNAVITKSIC